jgi:cytochrome bd-type quinol oxidase subunit 2
VEISTVSGAVIFKALVILLLLVILVALSSGMFFLVKDKGESDRTVKSLTVRIVLSVALFLLLFIGFATGLIEPHGITPVKTEKALP